VVDAATGTLGSYYGLVSSKVLLSTGKSEHTTEMTDFQGLRWAQLEETAEAGRLDVTKLKQTVGTAQITARRMRKDNITFDSTHTLFISTNHLPLINETDHGSWRRLALLKFPYTFVRDPKPLLTETDIRADESLKWRCMNDTEIHKAVLVWLVDGAMKWFANGDGTIGKMPPLPQKIVDDTFEWRSENDLILKFAMERLVFDPDYTVPTSHLNHHMNEWLRAQSQGKWSEKTFTQRFQNHTVVLEHGVSKGRFRVNEYTSQAPAEYEMAPELGAMYAGYKGVRFRTKSDGE
jgi:phage/plasmid-associated DNA primase